MIVELAEAIVQQYKADLILKNALADGLYYEQAPEELTGDYCVFYILGGSQEEIMGDADDCIKNLDVQFNLFSDTADGGETIATLKKYLSTCFDWVTLRVDDYNSIKMEPISWSALPVMDNIRQITVIYEAGIIKE